MFANLFDSHPELSVYPSDLSILYAYYPAYLDESFDSVQRRARLALVVRVSLERMVRKHGLEAAVNVSAVVDRLMYMIPDGKLGDMGFVIESLLEASGVARNARATDAKWTIAKETSIEIYAPYLDQWFPNCSIFQVVRDPRDNYSALKAGKAKHYGRFGESERHLLASLIHRSRLGMQMALINREEFGTHRYLVVRFEDLVAETVAVMQEACHFLGVTFGPSVLTPTVMGRPTPGNNYDGRDLYSVASVNVGRWRERITEFEAQVLEFHLGDLMESFGYGPIFAPAAQRRAAADFYKWMNHEFFYKDSFAPLSGDLDVGVG